MKYVYEGPGPHEDEELGLVRPGDVREFGAEPGWGPWRLLEEPEPGDPRGAQGGPAPSRTQAAVTPPASPPAASAPPAAGSALKPGGM